MNVSLRFSRGRLIVPWVRLVHATGSAPAVVLRMASVSLLGLEVRDLRVICHELPSRLGLQGILGINFLNRFNIEISFKDNETNGDTQDAQDRNVPSCASLLNAVPSCAGKQGDGHLTRIFRINRIHPVHPVHLC